MSFAALAFLLTVAIEWPLLAWCSRLGFRRTGFFCVCLNGATWGAAMVVQALWPVRIVILEGAIMIVEAALLAWFWQWRLGRAFATSLAMNLTSWLLGKPLLFLVDPQS